MTDRRPRPSPWETDWSGENCSGCSGHGERNGSSLESTHGKASHEEKWVHCKAILDATALSPRTCYRWAGLESHLRWTKDSRLHRTLLAQRVHDALTAHQQLAPQNKTDSRHLSAGARWASSRCSRGLAGDAVTRRRRFNQFRSVDQGHRRSMMRPAVSMAGCRHSLALCARASLSQSSRHRERTVAASRVRSRRRGRQSHSRNREGRRREGG